MKAVDDWLRIESKLTGLCFQPAVGWICTLSESVTEMEVLLGKAYL